MQRFLALVLSVVAFATLLFTGPASAARPIVDWKRLPVEHRPPPGLSGLVSVGGEPAPGWQVDLYATSAAGATLIGSTASDGKGEFGFRRDPRWATAVLYLLARKGTEGRLLALLGPGQDVPAEVVLNERATIASVWAAAQFIEGDAIYGNDVGLRNAAGNVPNLVDLSTGQLGAVVQNTVNGTRTTTLATLNTLASLLADCLRDGCGPLFAVAAPKGEPAPTNALQAFLYIARNPWNHVRAIFALRPPADPTKPERYPVFLPTLLWAPTGWTLSLVYTEGGFQAPGGLSIDADGNAWTNNNFMVGSQSALFAPGVTGVIGYSGIGITKLAPNGEALSPPSGFVGGGVFAGAFGVSIDRGGHVWLGNFAGDSISELRPDGSAVSPDSDPTYGPSGGYKTSPPLNKPQSNIFDLAGNLWITNLGGNTVTEFVGSDPTVIRTYGGPDCSIPFDMPWGLASDAEGHIWVTNFGSDSVVLIDPGSAPPYCPTAQYRLSLDPDEKVGEPEGVAVDSSGNVWVARTGGASVSLLEKAAGFQPPLVFDGGGSIVGPWGVAVDGADNVWVSDFFGSRLINLCGTGGNCPSGHRPGDPISPGATGGGYGGNGGLQHLTGVKVDQAGNVWVVNNFQSNEVCLLGAGIPPEGEPTTVPVERRQTECGGNGLVVFLGIAAPTQAPVVGPPAPAF